MSTSTRRGDNYHFSREQEEERIGTLKRALDDMPREWSGRDTRKEFRITLEPEDATRITSLAYEECDRGLIDVNIHTTPGPHGIVVELALIVIAGVGSEYAIRGLDRLIKKMRERLSKRLQDKEKRLG
jgi:hypothetical protein